MSASELERVKERIGTAFVDLTHPAVGEIACDCLSVSCEGLIMEREFEPFLWQNVPGDLVDRFASSLPIFTAEGYRYFLPAYMLRALESPDSEVWEAVIHGLPGVVGGAAAFLPPMQMDLPEQSMNMLQKVAQLLEEHEEDRLHDFSRTQIEAMVEFVEYLIANPSARTEDFIEDLFGKAESLEAFLSEMA